MSMISRSLPISLLLTALAIGCSEKEVKSLQPKIVSAPTAAVAAITVPDTREIAGTVRAGTSATLSARVVGNVTRVLVREGESVRSGQVLLEIDDRDTRAQSARASAGVEETDRAIEGAAAGIRAAEANAELAESTFKRYAALRERGSVSAQEYDEVRSRAASAGAELQRSRRGHAQTLARRNEARAAVTQAEAFVDYSRIRAPFDGVVTARLVDPGAQAAPGVPLLTIEQTGQHRVEATVDESVSTLLHVGDRVRVTIGSAIIDGTIATIVPSFSASARSALVKVALPAAAAVQSGSYAAVGFTTGSRQTIIVPADALTRREAPAAMFVVDKDGIARLRLVTTGAFRNGDVEILSGIDAGETIVTRAANVRDGERVSKVQAAAAHGRGES